RHLAALRGQYGAPGFCYFHLTKNVETRNLITVETLLDAGIGCHVAVSMQSFEPDVLHAIERDNISHETYAKVQRHCAERDIPTANELLLGLPGQTYDGFADGLVRAMTPWPRDSYFVYPVRLLENAAMASEAHRLRYGLQTRRTRMLPPSLGPQPEVIEIEELVVGSNTLSVQEWRRALALSALTGALYNLQLGGVVLALFRFSLAVDVRRWLETLLDAVLGAPRDHVFAELARDIEQLTDAILADN